MNTAALFRTFSMSAYELIGKDLPRTEENLHAEIYEIDQLTSKSRGEDSEYSLDRRSELLQRRILLANMRKLYLRIRKENWVQTRPFATIRDISSGSIFALSNILQHLENIEPVDIQTIQSDPVAAEVMLQCLEEMGIPVQKRKEE